MTDTTGHPHRPVVNTDVSDKIMVPSPHRGRCEGCVFIPTHGDGCPHDENDRTPCTREADGTVMKQDYIWIEDTEAAIAAYVAQKLGG